MGHAEIDVVGILPAKSIVVEIVSGIGDIRLDQEIDDLGQNGEGLHRNVKERQVGKPAKMLRVREKARPVLRAPDVGELVLVALILRKRVL
ncbi:MAG: hypothetical protein WBW73_08740 [Rhodoplanes sp.]